MRILMIPFPVCSCLLATQHCQFGEFVGWATSIGIPLALPQAIIFRSSQVYRKLTICGTYGMAKLTNIDTSVTMTHICPVVHLWSRFSRVAFEPISLRRSYKPS